MKTVTMKKAKFITCPQFESRHIEIAWGNGFFNNKGVDIPDIASVSSFRKDFICEKEIASAVVRATAVGLFEIYINGERVGDNGVFDELKPTHTDYNYHTFAYTYDVTAMLGRENSFCADVSTGWRSGRISRDYYENEATAFCGEIEITYTDGTSEIIATDESFLSTVGGPVRAADIWDGWRCDARIAPLYKSAEAKELVNAVIYNGKYGELVEPICENIRVDEKLTRTPISATVHCGTVDNGSDYGKIVVVSKKVGKGCEKVSLKKGESIILDMGQNTVGRPCFEIKAPAGTTVKGYCAELLNDSGFENRGNDGPEGSMYIKNYRSALARVYYIANGDGIEKVDPLHVFYGFRYFEITADADIEILSFKGLVMKTDMKQTGTFSCSDAEVNKLFSNVIWGARGNYVGIPTDCPQRDERYGWTGDTQVFCNAGSYLLDTRLFFRKWLTDMRDSQQGFNGAYCCIAPRLFDNEGGNAAWADAGIIVPNVMYRMFGDVELLKEHFDSMCDYMDYIYNKNGLEGPNTAYGDWLCYDFTDKRYIAVCYFAYDAELMIKFCRILAELKDEKSAFYLEKKAHFENRLAEIKAHWLEKYFADGDLVEEMRTQTGYLLALAFGLVPENSAEDFKAYLRKKIEDNNYTLSTGFVGTGVLAETLQSIGAYDLAYDLLLQTNDPSWLYSVRQGATTIWERWNSYTIAKGFGDVGMNSFNHYAYGAVAQWMFDGICGILPGENTPGFSKFRLFPTPDFRTLIPEGQNRMTHAEAVYNSYDGEIRSSWAIENGKYVYSFTVPNGTSATVGLLKKEDGKVTVNGVDFTAEELGAEIRGDRLCFNLAEGEYTVQ